LYVKFKEWELKKVPKSCKRRVRVRRTISRALIKSNVSGDIRTEKFTYAKSYISRANCQKIVFFHSFSHFSAILKVKMIGNYNVSSCFEFWIGFYFSHTVLISNLYHILRDSDSINTSPALLLCSDAGAARTQSVWNCWPETSDWNSTLRRTAKLETNLKSHFFRIGIFFWRFLHFLWKSYFNLL
jgi:hypothetical protein